MATILTVEFPSFPLHPSVLFRIVSLDKDFYPLNEKVEPYFFVVNRKA